MNENIDLTKILDGCPKGAKFYSPMMGNVKFDSIVGNFIYVTTIYGNLEVFDNQGIYGHYHGECMLLPSKDQRDWSKFVRFWDKPKAEKFDMNTLQPFDKVLARDADFTDWCICSFFSHMDNVSFPVYCSRGFFKVCIPYNEDTKHLVGTSEDCPDYYKWWEE